MFELRDMPVEGSENRPSVMSTSSADDILEVCIYTLRADTAEDRLVGVVRVVKQATGMGVGAFFSQLHEEFITNFPRFQTVKFHYLVDDRPIFPEHYDMLLCPANVTIAPGSVHASATHSRNASVSHSRNASATHRRHASATHSRNVSGNYGRHGRRTSVYSNASSNSHHEESPVLPQYGAIEGRTSVLSAGAVASAGSTPQDGPSPVVSPSGNPSVSSSDYTDEGNLENSPRHHRRNTSRSNNFRMLRRMSGSRSRAENVQKSATEPASMGGFRRKNSRRTNSSSNLPLKLPEPLPAVEVSPKLKPIVKRHMSIPDMPNAFPPPPISPGRKADAAPAAPVVARLKSSPLLLSRRSEPNLDLLESASLSISIHRPSISPKRNYKSLPHRELSPRHARNVKIQSPFSNSPPSQASRARPFSYI